MNAGIFGLESASTIKRDYLGLSYGVATNSRDVFYPNLLPLNINNSFLDNTYSIICNEMSITEATTGSSGYRIIFAMGGNNISNPIFIDWGDGSVTNYGIGGTNLQITHYYSTPGPYLIKVTGGINTVGRSAGQSLTSITHVLSLPSATNLIFSFRASVNNIQVIASLPPRVTNLTGTFQSATLFNYNLSHWNTSNVTIFSNTFNGCSSLNQPFNSWNTSSCQNFSSMFNGCSSLNQDFSSWNFSSCTNLSSFMTGVTLNTAHYDALLILWNTYKNDWFSSGSNMSPNMGSSKYSAGAAATARASLVTKGWSITDGGPA